MIRPAVFIDLILMMTPCQVNEVWGDINDNTALDHPMGVCAYLLQMHMSC